jgi:uroporphyrinogen decarboxylase
MSTSHRERVKSLFLNHKPDYPVVDLGGFVCSFNLEPYLDLKSYLGFGTDIDEETITFIGTIGRMDERVLQYFEIPFRRIWPKTSSSYTIKILEDGSFFDEWGILLRPMGHYYERAGEPLREATIKDLDNYPWPDPYDPARVESLAQEVHELYHETDFSLVASPIWTGLFQQCWFLRGMDRFFQDMITDRDFAVALLERVSSIYAGLWETFLNVVGDYVDFVETADDLAGQMGPMISPHMYRELVKPAHAKQFDAIRRSTNAKIFFHSDGALMPLIDDLIDIGMDILNPLQPIPGLMEPEILRERYGERLIFHGGLDVQTLLPKGSPEEVRSTVRHYLDTLGPERYIMAPANIITPGTPPENLVAAFDEAHNYFV